MKYRLEEHISNYYKEPIVLLECDWDRLYKESTSFKKWSNDRYIFTYEDLKKELNNDFNQKGLRSKYIGVYKQFLELDEEFDLFEVYLEERKIYSHYAYGKIMKEWLYSADSEEIVPELIAKKIIKTISWEENQKQEELSESINQNKTLRL